MTHVSPNKRGSKRENNELDGQARAAKRARNESESELENRRTSAGDIGKKQPNRLQRAIPKATKQTVTTTAAQAKRIKLAEKNKGLLASFLDYPIDIFYEVLYHLEPADLLCLSRVSRRLREFLLLKSKRWIWITSLEKAGLPPCPQDLNEPQYASLMFDTECVACNAPHIKSLHCDIRLRLCKECFNLNVVESIEVMRDYLCKGMVRAYREEIDAIREAVCEYTPFVISNQDYRTRLYYIPDLWDAIEESLAVYRTKSSAEFEAFVNKKLLQASSFKSDTILLNDYLSKKASERALEITDISGKHEESVKLRLRDLGYLEEDWSYTVDENHWEDMDQWKKLARQKRQLTDRTWKTLYPKLKEFLEMRKDKIKNTKRRAEFKFEYLRYYHDLCLTFGETRFISDIDVIINHPLASEFIYYGNSEREITDELWLSFMPTLEKILPEIRNEALAAHARKVVQYRSTGTRTLDLLQEALLASSFFTTYYLENSNGNAVYYFNSEHTVGTHPPRDEDREERHTLWLALTEIYPMGAGIADRLLLDLGLSLATRMATVQNAGRMFVCRRCPEPYKQLLNWSEIVLHYLNENNVDSKVCSEARCRKLGISFVKDHDLTGGNLIYIANEVEAVVIAELHATQSNLPKVMECKLCSRLLIKNRGRMTQPQIEEHIRSKHAKEPNPEDFEL